MPRPDVLSGPFAEGRRLSPIAGRSPLSLAGCTPVPGPSRRPVAAVTVDDELVWVTAVPTLALGAARAPSPAAFVHFCVQLAEVLAAAGCPAHEAALSEADLVDAAARAIAGYLDDLPDLPLVGEPFGGEEGSD
ncbi:MAG: hypothetical protein ACM3MJ_02265 [Deltaproteobacteria bacterium]